MVLEDNIIKITLYCKPENKMEDINTILNQIEILDNELEKFITHIKSQKEGKDLSRDTITKMFYLYKLNKLEQTISIMAKAI